MLTAGNSLCSQQAEALLADGKYAAAAAAFAACEGRDNQLQAGHAWSEGQDFEHARMAYRRVVRPLGRKVVYDSLTGVALHKLGVLYYNSSQVTTGARYYRQAIAVRDSVFPDPHNERAHSRNNLATCMRELKQLDSATLLVNQSIAIYEQLTGADTIRWLRTLNELSTLALLREDLQQANSAFNLTEKLLASISFIHPEDAFESYYVGAQNALAFGNYERAVRVAQLALVAADKTPWPDLRAVALIPLAGAWLKQEELKKARTAYLASEAILTGPEIPDRSPLFFVYLNLGTIATVENQPQAALRFARQAEVYLADGASLRDRAELALVKGKAMLETGQLQQALTIFNGGLGLFDPAARQGTTSTYRPATANIRMSDYNAVARLFARRAEVFATLGQRRQALRDYENYVDIMDQLRGRVSSDVSRHYLSRDARAYFDEAISLYLAEYEDKGQQNDLWRAFGLSERAKAYTLLANLERNRGSMSEREIRLRSRIAELERRVVDQASVRSLLESARLALDRLVGSQQREVSVPEWDFDRAALTALLARQDMALVVYHFGRKYQHRFDLSPAGQLSVATLDLPGLEADVATWISALKQSAYRRKSLRPAAEQRRLDEALLRGGLHLHKILLPAAAPLHHRVCIVPDGVLNYLPFAALPDAPATLPIDYTSYPALQNKSTISYAYSASFLLELQRPATTNYAHNVLAFAPAFGQQALAATTRGERGLRPLPGLQPLRFNREEVEAIDKLVPGVVTYFEASADRANFQRAAGTGRVIHLSSHGLVDAADPKLSFIAFSQLNDSLELEEMLYFNDLSALRLPTEMAVLSACETSLGTYVPGETTLSLASAFAAAGARSTLTTLWQVDDAATKDLMINFYAALVSGETRSDALSVAQTAHRKNPEYAHPYYWSAMTLYGATGTIDFAPAAFSYWWWLIGGLLVLGVAGILVRWRKKSSPPSGTRA